MTEAICFFSNFALIKTIEMKKHLLIVIALLIVGSAFAQKEEIIKKQQAACEKYAKKAEKLRAQFAEGEKEAATAIAAEDPKMKEVGDGELVLEGGISIKDIFGDK